MNKKRKHDSVNKMFEKEILLIISAAALLTLLACSEADWLETMTLSKEILMLLLLWLGIASAIRFLVNTVFRVVNYFITKLTKKLNE